MKGFDTTSTATQRVERAIEAIRVGRPIVVVDDEDRENEGDLIFAAEHATPELMAFTVRHTSGFVCVGITGSDARRLHLPPMHHTNEDRRGTAYTVSVDAAANITTGISATDRSHTIRLLAGASTGAGDLTRPGHVLPLIAREGGVLTRPGHTEAGVDLARLAGLRPAAALCEIVSDRDPTRMAAGAELFEFCERHQLIRITIADLIAYRRAAESIIERRVQARLPLPQGIFTATGFRTALDRREHVALSMGDISSGEDVLVRVHSECMTGDVFGSLRCDCGPQLEASLRAVAREKRGVVLYLRGHEGRGIGLLRKLEAYQLQDAGADTVDANLELGLPVDARDYGTGAEILKDLGIKSMRLLTSNPLKQAGLEGYGLHVNQRVSLPVLVTPDNLRYLITKKERLGHRIELAEALGPDETTEPVETEFVAN